MAAPSALSFVSTAREHLPRFFEGVGMEDKDFAASAFKSLRVHQILRVPESAVVRHSNATVSAKGVREIFRSYSFISRTHYDVVTHLLDSRVLCKFCYKKGSAAGSILTNKCAIDAHAATSLHKDQVAAAVARKDGLRQSNMLEQGVTIAPPSVAALRLKARYLASGSLVAGGHGAKGVPPSAIQALMGREQLILQEHMDGGFPSTRTIILKDLPAVVELVRDWIRDVYFARVRDFAISIDGGSSLLANGAKCLAATCLTPAWPWDICLALNFAFTHETGESQAFFIHTIFKRYYPRVARTRVRYLVTDNSALNALCAQFMRDMWEFKNVTFRRCLPHSLSLVMNTLFKPFEDEFGLVSHMREIRAFTMAGGGSTRRRHLFEYGLSLAQIDFSKTRWEGVFAAIKYLMSKQSTRELAYAKKILTLSAADGDKTAIEALHSMAADAAAGVPVVPLRHWDIVYLAVSDIVVDKANGELCVPQDALLNYNADVANFGAAFLLCSLAEGAPGVFRVSQGSAAWAPAMREEKSENLVTAVSSVRALLVTIDRLQNKETRVALIEETTTASRAHQEELLAAALRDNELNPADEGAARARNELNLKAAARKWKHTLHAATRALKPGACPGRKKLDEAVNVLAQQQLFNINVKPVPLPDSDASFIEQFMVPPSLAGFAKLATLRAQWIAHCAAWSPPTVAPPGVPGAAPALAGRKRMRGADGDGGAAAAGGAGVAAAGGAAAAPPVLSQRTVHDYWAALAESAPELSRLALHSWLSPMSSASVERIFSLLTQLDTPERRSMERGTLEMILFLRANWRIVELLRLDLADVFGAAAVPADRIGEAAAAIATAATIALHTARAEAAAEAALFEEMMPAVGGVPAAAAEVEGEDAAADVADELVDED